MALVNYLFHEIFQKINAYHRVDIFNLTGNSWCRFERRYTHTLFWKKENTIEIRTEIEEEDEEKPDQQIKPQ